MVKRPVVLDVSLVFDSSYPFLFLQFLLPFSRKRLLLRWIVAIGKGIRSSLEELCESRGCFWLLSQDLLLCHAMKMCHVCYYNNSDATFRILMSGDNNPNPGPVSALTAGKKNCLLMNTRSLKRYLKDSITNWQSACKLQCLSKTWLNQNFIFL